MAMSRERESPPREEVSRRGATIKVDPRGARILSQMARLHGKASTRRGRAGASPCMGGRMGLIGARAPAVGRDVVIESDVLDVLWAAASPGLVPT
jgi:hypothetical protein